jgi:outer membrane receptor protein involved in Fe transport
MHSIRHPVALLLAVFAVSAPGILAGQQSQATVHGIVRTQDGEPLAGARVAFGGAGLGSTDQAGRFTIAVPAHTPAAVHFSALGHRPDSVAVGALPAGSRTEISVTLARLFVLDALTVVSRRERPLVDTESGATGGALEAHEIEALPTDARDPLSLAANIPGVAQATGFFGDAPPLTINGQNALYAQYLLDDLDNNEGFLGGPRVELPLGALERLEVLTNGYGAAFGRSPSGVVNAFSRAGGPVWAGDVFAYWRPGHPLDAEPKRVTPGVDPEGFQRLQIGAGAGGPIAGNQTFVFGAVEYVSEDEDRIGSTARTQFIGTERRQTLKLLGRADHGWSPSQTTTLRVALSSVSRAGQGTGVIVPEADVTTRRIGSIAALTHRTGFGSGRGANTATVQLGTYRWYFPPTRSDFSRPQVTIRSADDSTIEAVVGSSNFVFDEAERQLQLRNVVELAAGSHTLRAGADLIRSWFELTGAGTNPLGAYEVLNDGRIVADGEFVSFTDIPADVPVMSYTVDASPVQVNLTQTLVGAFVEDRWRVAPDVMLVAGVRWDYDDITSRGESDPDLDNVQPRLSLNWLRTPTSVIRGSVGRYTGKLPYAVYSDAVQFGPDGNAIVTFTGDAAPGYLEGPTPTELQERRDQLPPREIRRAFALGLEQPTSWQANVGTQMQLGDDWGLSLDAVWVETRDLPRSIDLNPLPTRIGPNDTEHQPCDGPGCPGDDERPVPPVAGSFRRLTTTESGGRARYLGLYAAVRRRMSQGWTLDANWVWSRARTDTEDINFNASQANCFGEDRRDAYTGAPCTSDEWADAVNDRRHKLTLRSIHTFADRLRVALVGDYQTGLPANRVAGVVSPDGGIAFHDLDGSGPIYGDGFIGNRDRYYGVQRNSERLPGFFELSGSAAYLLPLGTNRIELRADVFNAFNATQWAGFATGVPGGGSRTQVGRPGDPLRLGQPGRPREIQLSARYVF